MFKSFSQPEIFALVNYKSSPKPDNLILFSVRPLRIHWVSENVRTANEEIDRLDAEYADLKPCEVDHIHPGLKVKYNGLWSMLDGKLLQ